MSALPQEPRLCLDAPSPGDESLTISALVQAIHDGRQDPASIDMELRQQCVAALDLEGFTNGQIAQLLRVTERTVTRDRTAYRRINALAPDARLGDELLGEFHRLTLTSIQRLARLTTDKAAPPAIRRGAEESISRIYHRFLDTVQRLNYFEGGNARIRKQVRTEANGGKDPLAGLPKF